MNGLSEVLACLMNYADMEGYTAAQLQPSCERGLLWVYNHLRPGTDKESPLVIHTSAALAHYFFFLSRLTDADKYESFTAGDMTVRKNIAKELEFETNAKNEAIAAAASILRDGGFFFSEI